MTVVQVIILIVSLAVYGFAPIGLGIVQEPSDTLDLSLDFRQVMRNVTQNIWLGPSQVNVSVVQFTNTVYYLFTILLFTADFYNY